MDLNDRHNGIGVARATIAISVSAHLFQQGAHFLKHKWRAIGLVFSSKRMSERAEQRIMEQT